MAKTGTRVEYGRTKGWGMLHRSDLAAAAALGAGPGVLFALLTTYAGRDGTCFPSQKTIGETLGVSGSTVTRWRKQLEDAGLLKIVGAPAPGRCTVYQLGIAPVQSEESTVLTSEQRTVLTSEHPNKTIGTNHMESPAAQVQPDPQDDTPVDQILTHWNAAAERNDLPGVDPANPRRRKQAQALLKEAGGDVLLVCRAIDQRADSEHWRGETAARFQGNFDTLCRPSNRLGYLDAARHAGETEALDQYTQSYLDCAREDLRDLVEQGTATQAKARAILAGYPQLGGVSLAALTQGIL